MSAAYDELNGLLIMVSRLEALASLACEHPESVAPDQVGQGIREALAGTRITLLTPDGCPLKWDDELQKVCIRGKGES